MVSLSGLQNRLESLQTRLALQSKEIAADVLEKTINPAFLQKKIDATTRVGQSMAVLFVPIVIMVSLPLIVVFNQLLRDIFGGWGSGDAQLGFFGFFITALTLGLFIFAAWIWFQFVRTSGFGMFAWEDNDT